MFKIKNILEVKYCEIDDVELITAIRFFFDNAGLEKDMLFGNLYIKFTEYEDKDAMYFDKNKKIFAYQKSIRFHYFIDNNNFNDFGRVKLKMVDGSLSFFGDWNVDHEDERRFLYDVYMKTVLKENLEENLQAKQQEKKKVRKI